MILNGELVEQSPLSFLPWPHNCQLPLALAKLNQRPHRESGQVLHTIRTKLTLPTTTRWSAFDYVIAEHPFEAQSGSASRWRSPYLLGCLEQGAAVAHGPDQAAVRSTKNMVYISECATNT